MRLERDGLILRFDGVIWRATSSPLKDLILSIQGGPGMALQAVGARGTVLDAIR
jgi:hypothetical protein